jgi:hypothetical protein
MILADEITQKRVTLIQNANVSNKVHIFALRTYFANGRDVQPDRTFCGIVSYNILNKQTVSREEFNANACQRCMKRFAEISALDTQMEERNASEHINNKKRTNLQEEIRYLNREIAKLTNHRNELVLQLQQTSLQSAQNCNVKQVRHIKYQPQDVAILEHGQTKHLTF